MSSSPGWPLRSTTILVCQGCLPSRSGVLPLVVGTIDRDFDEFLPQRVLVAENERGAGIDTQEYLLASAVPGLIQVTPQTQCTTMCLPVTLIDNGRDMTSLRIRPEGPGEPPRGRSRSRSRDRNGNWVPDNGMRGPLESERFVGSPGGFGGWGCRSPRGFEGLRGGFNGPPGDSWRRCSWPRGLSPGRGPRGGVNGRVPAGPPCDGFDGRAPGNPGGGFGGREPPHFDDFGRGRSPPRGGGFDDRFGDRRQGPPNMIPPRGRSRSPNRPSSADMRNRDRSWDRGGPRPCTRRPYSGRPGPLPDSP